MSKFLHTAATTNDDDRAIIIPGCFFENSRAKKLCHKTLKSDTYTQAEVRVATMAPCTFILAS